MGAIDESKQAVFQLDAKCATETKIALTIQVYSTFQH